MTIERFPSPAAGGRESPYSRAVRSNGFVFVSGQVALNADGVPVGGGFEAEARQAIENVRAVLNSVGRDLEHVVKATVWLTDIKDFAAFNAVYREYFGSSLPARACVQAQLMGPFSVEIEVIASAG